MEYPNTHIQWGAVWPELALAAIKEMEQGYCTIMLQLIKSRLQENLKQGNTAAGFKDPKRKQVEFGRTLGDFLSYLTQIVCKIQSVQEVSPQQFKVCE